MGGGESPHTPRILLGEGGFRLERRECSGPRGPGRTPQRSEPQT